MDYVGWQARRFCRGASVPAGPGAPADRDESADGHAETWVVSGAAGQGRSVNVTFRYRTSKSAMRTLPPLCVLWQPSSIAAGGEPGEMFCGAPGSGRWPGFRWRVPGPAGGALAGCGVMGGSPPGLRMLSLVVADMPASLDFCCRLGVAVPDGGDAAGPHVQLRMPGGFSPGLDTAGSARVWHAGWRAGPASVRVVIGFALPAREAAGRRCAELASAGCAGRQPPSGALWGARCAIVAGPGGNDVGLMSPAGGSRRTWPPQESPAP